VPDFGEITALMTERKEAAALFSSAISDLKASEWSHSRRLECPIHPLLFVVFTSFFFRFRPKTACQVLKPPNSIKKKEIGLAI
jgi:hypothetical protein